MRDWISNPVRVSLKSVCYRLLGPAWNRAFLFAQGRCRSLTGFHASRFREWATVVRKAGTETEPWRLAWNMAKVFVRGLFRRDRRRLWRWAMRHCIRCPYYHGGYKRCGVMEGHGGCFCYTPFKNLFLVGPCWGRENKGPDVGFDTREMQARK